MGLKKPLTSARARALGMVAAVAVLSACAGAPGPDGINDPFEASNREVHAFNKALDRAVLRPAARGYGAVVPDPVQRAVGNVVDTLDVPGDIVNNLLQGRIGHAAENTLRLGLNLTFGLLGTIDLATAAGMPDRSTDFGETLHAWGVGEGVYLERPFTGPSTARDAAGALVDLALNPVRLALPEREAVVAAAARVLSLLGDRNRFSATIDSILYDSADSYAQSRLLYLQNRRFELGQGTAAGTAAADAGFIDPYEDPYAQ